MPGIIIGDIVKKEKLTDTAFALTVRCPQISEVAVPGQFVNVKCGEESLLRRPISICSVDSDLVKLVFEVKGQGTGWLAQRLAGQSLDLLGPLGKGFSLPLGDTIVVGGGIGVPPLLFTAQSTRSVVTAVLGFQDSGRVILKDVFEEVCDKVYITTDDGSCGIHGMVTGLLAKLLEEGKYKAVLACGPRAMLQAVAMICKHHSVPCQVSLEERMACGVGACMVCACAMVKDGAVVMSRVCKDGPVFPSDEVGWS